MKILITFCKGHKELTSFPFPIESSDDYRAALMAGYDAFRKEHPDLTLADGISIVFDKAS
jgi:hypothetical protein